MEGGRHQGFFYLLTGRSGEGSCNDSKKRGHRNLFSWDAAMVALGKNMYVEKIGNANPQQLAFLRSYIGRVVKSQEFKCSHLWGKLRIVYCSKW